MKVIGIIAEFNPFHNGHAYLIEQAKKDTGADYCVIVMSGDFVQRGAPAIISKYTRAEIALRHGTDLVIEMPAVFATASAEGFARCGVKLLNQLGIIDVICFGSEENALAEMTEAAHILSNESDTFKESLRSAISLGKSFPHARMDALLSELSGKFDGELPELKTDLSYQERLRDLLSSPNNVLGLEYIKAIKQLGSSLKIHTISRQGAEFHSDSINGTFASATAIRKILSAESKTDVLPCNTEMLKKVMPADAVEHLESLYGRQFPISETSYYGVLLYQLQSTTPNELTQYLDVPEWLANRLCSLWQDSTDMEHLIQLCKAKNVPYTTIARALFHILLQIPQDLFDHYHDPKRLMPYVKVLGIKKEFLDLISVHIRQCQTPWIMRMTDCSVLEYDKTTMNSYAKALWETDLKATLLYQSIKTSVYHTPMENEYKRKVLII